AAAPIANFSDGQWPSADQCPVSVQADSTWVDAPRPRGEPGAVGSPESRVQGPSAPAIGSDPRRWPDPGIWMDGAVPSAPVLSAQAETEGEVSPNGLPPLDQEAIRALILQADRQTYDPERQIVTASGDVLVQFGNSQLAADRLWVNLGNRHLRAEGNVFFNRNDQVIEGDTATYNLLQGAGAITNGRGELELPTLGADLAGVFPNDLRVGTQPIDYRLQGEGSISQVTSPGGVSFGTDSTQVLFGGEESELRRLRFESETIFFDADGWYAENLRITNDPFSPPELEFRSNNVRLTPLNEEEDELVFDSPRFVFDDGLTIPVLRNRYILQRGQFPTDELNPLRRELGLMGAIAGGYL
ncbi:MAG: DUF3769 domain-containing protein, partial [Leptolyngbyaceae cyanobacterium SM2_3_12]|nr:DUF3769 domain-containing protein [Leptolyngbyaceae cyanobacterium SM2_3_12]